MRKYCTSGVIIASSNPKRINLRARISKLFKGEKKGSYLNKLDYIHETI